MSEKRTKGWHFLQTNKHLRWGTKEVVKPGGHYSCKGKISLCENGLHASKTILDALYYAPGPVVCRVEVWGDVVRSSDKLAGRNRAVLWMLDATNVLHEFACRCAEDALALVKKPDGRSLAAIEAKRAWMRCEITDEELAAAGEAAGEAAWEARVAARDAAGAAAGAAAGEAAWEAAWDAQKCRLTSMTAAAHAKEATQ